MSTTHAVLPPENSTNVRLGSPPPKPDDNEPSISAAQLNEAVEELIDLDNIQLDVTWADIEADLMYGRD